MTNATDTDKKTTNAAAANDFAGEPHGNPNEKLNENRPMDTTKEQRGDMTPEEYTNQPESNINASVMRDVDEEPTPNTEQLKEQTIRAENEAQLERDIRVQKEREAELAQEQQRHADEVAKIQKSKLDSNTKPGTSDDTQ